MSIYGDIDTSDYELDTPGLAVGIHKVMITKEEIIDTPHKPTNPKRLAVTFEAVEGACKGRSQISNFNLWNANPKAVEIAKQDLKKIDVATGRPVNTENPLKGRVLAIEVRKQKDNPDYTEVGKYLPESAVNPADIPFN